MLWRSLVVLYTLLLTFPASAQAPHELEGRWALMADARPLAILEVRSHPDQGWTGNWTRPDRFAVNQSHGVLNISGPIVRRTMLSAAPRPEGLELSFEGRDGGTPDRYLLRATDRDHAELGFIDPLAIPPIPLVRVDEGAAVAANWAPGRTYLITASYPSNAEMAALYEADQEDRRAGVDIDWSVVVPRDRARRERTLQLLNAGALRSGEDYWRAAFIFQHGGETQSYLLAHTLAMIAAARVGPTRPGSPRRRSTATSRASARNRFTEPNISPDPGSRQRRSPMTGCSSPTPCVRRWACPP